MSKPKDKYRRPAIESMHQPWRRFFRRKIKSSPDQWEDSRENRYNRDRAIPTSSTSPVSLAPRSNHQNLSTTSISKDKNQDCLLIRRFPLEIRRIIYQHVVGGDTICLSVVPFRMSGHTTHERLPNRRLHPSTERTRFDLTRAPSGFIPRRTALLKTCRQIYVEAIDLMYSANVFIISDPHIFLKFIRTIPTQRIDAIQQLCIIYAFTFATGSVHECFARTTLKEWTDFWAAVLNMHDLRYLKVQLEQGEDGVAITRSKEDIETTTLRPLMRLRGLKDFQLKYQRFDSPQFPPYRVRALTQANIRLRQTLDETVKLPRE
ncbi:MAG: hypothetical protein Q9190_002744 [Brigantiaea leucoxantha]